MDTSGNLYGTTHDGGAYGYGTVFEIVQTSGTLTTLASFTGKDGAGPRGALLMDGSGNLYGATEGGGPGVNGVSYGTLFELAHGSGTITTLAAFDNKDGADPTGDLVMDGSGNLYGTATDGGAYWTAKYGGFGTVFELAHGSGTITTLASFDGRDAAYPTAGVVIDGSGNLYGTTDHGGRGTVFEVPQGQLGAHTLASFSGPNGSYPSAGLIMDSGGNLYGTTSTGGAYGTSAGGFGTVFELAKNSSTITTLASFDGRNGKYPHAGLVMDGSGNLYGTTEAGGPVTTLPGGALVAFGTVFELAAGSGTITRLASFNGTDGANPYAGLVMDGSGNLYGTAGTVFELAHGSSQITLVASFSAPNGIAPAGLLMDGAGDLIGTAQLGGASSDGTVFELAHGSGTLTTLASFSGTNGSSPNPPTMDSSGNLYGTTVYGGANGYSNVAGTGDGTIFELVKGSDTITTLASFDGTDGQNPLGSVVMDSSGNLYGISGGGAYGAGTVFELAHGSGAITTLASFDGTDGAAPEGALILDGSGNLYGTTYFGGASGEGTVFELAAGSATITTIASFDGTDGADPGAGLIVDSSGNLYGTTESGGASGGGTIFEVVQGSGTITTLASFDGTDGKSPGGLVMDSTGHLYGTTGSGGASNFGTVFRLAKNSGAITTLATFNPTNGTFPGSLVMDGSGDLYVPCESGAFSFGKLLELPGAAAPKDQWTGADSAVDTNWSDGANWSLGKPPTPGQTAVFTKNPSVKGFTATVDAGFTNAIGGLIIDGTWGGTITVNSALTVNGNFILASGSIGGSGSLTVAGDAMQWTGGQIVVGAGGFTNTGVLTADTSGGNLVVTGAGTFTNAGTITEAGTHGLVLENTATLDNAARATFDLTTKGSVTQSGGGTFANAGTLEKTGGTGTSTIATTSLDNTGIVEVSGGTLDIAAAVTQVSGSALTGGAWTVLGSPTVHSKLTITSAGGFSTLGTATQVTLRGPNATFSNLRRLRTIDTGASFSLFGGQSFTTIGALTDEGGLTLGSGSVLTVAGSFMQTAEGTLTSGLAGLDTAPLAIGQLVSTAGAVELHGTLHVRARAVPPVGSAFEVLDNEGTSAITGTFKGLLQGRTFKVTAGTKKLRFQITYAGTDADGDQNVLITRIS
jgi:uncharacterized repeat protein (TIGR03803 family)